MTYGLLSCIRKPCITHGHAEMPILQKEVNYIKAEAATRRIL